MFKKSAPSPTTTTKTPDAPSPQAPAATATTSSGLNVDFDLLRESIKEAEARKAQEGLDGIIREAVDKQTRILKSENDDLKKQLLDAQIQVNDAESHASSSTEELNSVRAEVDKLRLTLDEERTRTQQLIDMYESQVRALQTPPTPPSGMRNNPASGRHRKQSYYPADRQDPGIRRVAVQSGDSHQPAEGSQQPHRGHGGAGPACVRYAAEREGF